MFKKIKVILGIAALASLCAFFAACATLSKPDEYAKQGYKISVTYEANGGKFFSLDGVSVIRMYNPEDYEQDSNGNVHIKLSDPTSGTSTTGGGISLGKTGYFFAGWYRQRDLCLNESDKPYDSDGNILLEEDGNFYIVNQKGNFIDSEGNELVIRNDEYYILGTDKKGARVQSYPEYKYAERWDFENDTIEFNVEDEPLSITLYPGWVPYYRFDYYMEENGAWVKYGSTSFDYKSVNSATGTSSDHDRAYLPTWKDGAMNYRHTYNNGGDFTFPSVTDMTFSAAYTDQSCFDKIEEYVEHSGTLLIDTATAVGAVQNIYVKFDSGNRYRIETAEQLIKNADNTGIYEILGDLDFTDKLWPSNFASGLFKGVFASSQGNTFTIKNANVKLGSVTYGGLFGRIDAGARIENVIFENAEVDFGQSPKYEYYYGLFCGNISDGAIISGVTVGGTIKAGILTVPNVYHFNMVANGDKSGIAVSGISLTVYGLLTGNLDKDGYYEYSIKSSGTAVSDTGEITLSQAVTNEEKRLKQESFNIVSLWR